MGWNRPSAYGRPRCIAVLLPELFSPAADLGQTAEELPIFPLRWNLLGNRAILYLFAARRPPAAPLAREYRIIRDSTDSIGGIEIGVFLFELVL